MINFKEWFYFIEAIDQNTEKALKQQKVDPNELNDFINQLKNAPELIDTKSAFAKLQEKFPFLRKDKNATEAPTDPFFKQYYDQLTSKQITKPEYDALIFFKNENQGLLREMMQSLRNLIQQQKIQLTFNNNIPAIVYRNEPISSKDFVQFNATLHGIEGKNTIKTSAKNLADPFFLEVSHKEKLVAKNSDETIWVFKATGPLDCRLMGKGQKWCISSSSSSQWYFKYRYDYGQTQYFIFDFNKDEDDPARYVNPGVAIQKEDDEWVDADNEPDKINGYSSIKDYKNYLKSKGIDANVFVADPLTEEEKLLKQVGEKYQNSSYFEKHEIFKEFKEGKYKELFDKWIESMSSLDIGLTEDHFIKLSDHQKKLYLSNISFQGFNDLLRSSSKPDELINQIFPLVKDNLDAFMVEAMLHYSSNPDELINNQIFPLVKDKLYDDMVEALLRYSSNPDELINNQIFPLVKDKLNARMVSSLLNYSSNKDELINQIFPLFKDKLDARMVSILLHYSSNKDKLKKRIDAMKQNY